MGGVWGERHKIDLILKRNTERRCLPGLRVTGAGSQCYYIMLGWQLLVVRVGLPIRSFKSVAYLAYTWGPLVMYMFTYHVLKKRGYVKRHPRRSLPASFQAFKLSTSTFTESALTKSRKSFFYPPSRLVVSEKVLLYSCSRYVIWSQSAPNGAARK